MEININIVDWNEAEKRAKAGTLEDDLFDIEGGEDWIDVSKKWLNESYFDYCTIGESIDRHKNVLSKENLATCDQSISLFLNETSVMPRELGDALDEEYYVGAISPQTMKEIIYYCSKIDTKTLTDVFGQEAQQYIEEWINVFNEALSRNRGLFVHVG